MKKEIVDEPLNGYELQELMNDMNERLNLMIDTDITPDMNIEDIFKGKGNIVLFHPWEGQDVGHWVCMIRNKKLNKVYYFDSFGDMPYNKNIKKVILKSHPELLVNDVSFQPESSNACGKYCLMVISLNKMGLSPEQIELFLKSHGKKLNDFILKTVK
jgi:hypothetical protein